MCRSLPEFLIILLSCVVRADAYQPANTRPLTPNLIIILADDLGIGDVSAYGASDIHTPNIDSIAHQGIKFSGMRANATVCSPTRAALMTGYYADRVGVPGVIRTQPENSWGYLRPGVPTLADELRRLGYHTAIIGKWHLGLEAPNLPTQRGFDLFHGFLGDMMDSYESHLRHGVNYMRHNEQTITTTGHATDLFTEWALEFLRKEAETPETPFFLYLAYNAPHFPIEPPADWLDRVRARQPELPALRLNNVAFVEHLDENIGRVLKTLTEIHSDRNTVVVFTSDNGGSIPHGQSNLPWRDGKQSHYDGGLRIPFLMKWPGVISQGSVSDYSGLTFDLMPTFIEIAQGEPNDHLDAVSLLPLLTGGQMPETRDLYFVRREGGPDYGGRSYEAFIRGDWKLLQNSPYRPLELYNLREDPFETRDRIKSNPAIARELSAALQEQIRRSGAVPWQP
ncbi:MAG: sulfatase-like hydrolase/transferase [Planctomyces sp.]|nr:sulfatase-like hydrolase/transferase [Planctomyces sp.]